MQLCIQASLKSSLVSHEDFHDRSRVIWFKFNQAGLVQPSPACGVFLHVSPNRSRQNPGLQHFSPDLSVAGGHLVGVFKAV